MGGNYEQWLLPTLRFVPFVGSVIIVLYSLVTGRIPVRGRTISRSDHAGNYWAALLVIFLFIVLSTLYLAASQ